MRERSIGLTLRATAVNRPITGAVYKNPRQAAPGRLPARLLVHFMLAMWLLTL